MRSGGTVARAESSRSLYLWTPVLWFISRSRSDSCKKEHRVYFREHGMKFPILKLRVLDLALGCCSLQCPLCGGLFVVSYTHTTIIATYIHSIYLLWVSRFTIPIFWLVSQISRSTICKIATRSERHDSIRKFYFPSHIQRAWSIISASPSIHNIICWKHPQSTWADTRTESYTSYCKVSCKGTSSWLTNSDLNQISFYVLEIDRNRRQMVNHLAFR